ncbi:MAG: hypothetical protein E7316_03585 [Clostridiales bacterium]|nr:hypothetical protein [Clostridiales bacterium]
MDHTLALRSLIDEYLCQVDQLLRDAKPSDGLLGMGKAPQHDPCHEAFDQQVEACLSSAAAQELSSSEASNLAEILLFSEKLRDVPLCAGWMLIAVHRHCLLLVPLLTAQAAADLYERYRKAYPIHRRLPVQRELLKALQQRIKLAGD